MVWFVLTVMACPVAMVILSDGDGDPEGDQIAEVFQSPEAIEIRLMAVHSITPVSVIKIAARNFRKLVCMFFIQLFVPATEGLRRIFVLF